MTAGGPVLDLAAGAELVLDGAEWTVERREPHLGRVHLVRRSDGARQQVSMRFLANHPDCWPSSRTAAAGAERGRQPRVAQDLKPGRRELAELRMARRSPDKRHRLQCAAGSARFESSSTMQPSTAHR